MASLINPTTNLPFEQETLLEELRYWTTKPKITIALQREGWLTVKQLLNLGLRVIATLNKADIAKPLTPRETAICAHYFVRSRNVRKAIAKQMIEDGKADRILAMRGLMQFKKHLESEYNLEEVSCVYSKTD
jgi:hypothetical protein